MRKFLTTILFCLAIALANDACDDASEPDEPVSLRLLDGPAEVVVGVESPEFVGKLLGCFFDLGQEDSTIIEYRDDDPVGAVKVQALEVCFATHAHVDVGACLRAAMLDAGGQVL